ncbi:hypothetical protein [Bradyrhizobium lupini]|uniref:hypothetical protein n=1 Tax=Rhizobium lupini TaxID=136996 RepID=UPI0034C61663
MITFFAPPDANGGLWRELNRRPIRLPGHLVGRKRGQLLIDAGLLRARRFQLSSQREHVNGLQPVARYLNSLVGYSLAVAKIEQAQGSATGGPNVIVNLILFPFQPSGRLAGDDSRSFHLSFPLLSLGSALPFLHVLASDARVSNEIKVRNAGLLPACGDFCAVAFGQRARFIGLDEIGEETCVLRGAGECLQFIDQGLTVVRDDSVTEHKAGREPGGQSVDSLGAEVRQAMLLKQSFDDDGGICLALDFQDGHHAASCRRKN